MLPLSACFGHLAGWRDILSDVLRTKCLPRGDDQSLDRRLAAAQRRARSASVVPPRHLLSAAPPTPTGDRASPAQTRGTPVAAVSGVDSDHITAAVPGTRISEPAPWAEMPGQASQRELDLLVLEQVPMRALERVLFIQCGDGWAAEEAWRRASRSYVCGVDTSPTLVGLATGLRGVPGKVQFDAWDGRRLPMPDGSFDRVISRFALEHGSEPLALLREMHRVLRAGGELHLFETRRDPEAWGVAELRRLLERAGFVRVEEPAPGSGGHGPLILRARRSSE